MSSKRVDWKAYWHVLEVRDGILHRIRAAAAAGHDVTLTADDCIKLLARKPIGAPPPRGLEEAFIRICYFRLVKKGGMLPKNAVEETMRIFDCSRSTVYAARKVRATRPN